jgi:CHAT domain-containing protein
MESGRWRAWGTLAACIFLPALMAPAWAEPVAKAEWRSACGGAMQPRSPKRPADVYALAHDEPLQALSWACKRLSKGDEFLDALLELAQALILATRFEPAASLLEELDKAATVAQDGALKLALLRAELSHAQNLNAAAATQYESALALWRQQSKPATDIGVRVLLGYASVTRSLNKGNALQVAAESIETANKLLVDAKLENSYLMADVLNQKTMLAYTRDKLPQAVEWATRERDLIRKLRGPDAPAQLDALATLGAIAGQQRRYEDAVVHLTEGRRIGRRAPAAARSGYLSILNNLVPHLMDLGRHVEALEVASEAVAIAVAGWGANSVQTLTPLQRRAAAEEALQRLVQARRSYDQLMAIMQKEPAQIPMSRRLRLLETMAAFDLRMNDADSAQRWVDQGIALVPEGGTLPYWRGRLLRRAGLIAKSREEWERADLLLKQSRPLIAAANSQDHLYLMALDVLRCEVQLRGKLEPSACADISARLPSMRDALPDERVSVRRVLSLYAIAAQLPHAAFEHLCHALAAAQSEDGERLLWSALDLMSVHLREQGQGALAVLLAKSAVRRIEQVRQQFDKPSDLKTTWLIDRHATYRRLADWLAADGRIEECLHVLRLLKGDEYRGFVESRSDADPTADAFMPWTAAEKRWLQTSPLAVAAASPSAAPSRANASMGQIQAQEEARAKAWSQALAVPMQTISQTSAARLSGLTTGPLARSGEVIATVFMGQQHANFILSGNTERRLVRVAMDAQEVSRDVGRLLTRIERREETTPLLQSLFQRVAAPIAAFAQGAGATHLSLRLDGDLRYLPFAALHDGNAYLLQRFVIEQRVWQASDALPTRTKPSPKRSDTWVNAFGSTRAAPGMPALPGVAAEICGIVDGPIDAGSERVDCAGTLSRGATPGRAWINDAFTSHSLRQAAASGRANRFDMLHIGTHFVLRPGEIGRSWIQLGDGQRLQLQDMLTWRLNSQDLVTLSACQTGQGGGGEVEGLSALMLKLGANAVLSTLWRVEDRSTSELMREVYQQISAGTEPAMALRRAQLRALTANGQERSHPFFWAGFYLSTRSP